MGTVGVEWIKATLHEKVDEFVESLGTAAVLNCAVPRMFYKFIGDHEEFDDSAYERR